MAICTICQVHPNRKNIFFLKSSRITFLTSLISYSAEIEVRNFIKNKKQKEKRRPSGILMKMQDLEDQEEKTEKDTSKQIKIAMAGTIHSRKLINVNYPHF